MHARQVNLNSALFALLPVALVAGASCGLAHDVSLPLRRIDAATRRAADYLTAQQSPDGTWRSEVYAPFKEGDALTPLVLMALLEIPGADRRERPIDKGIRYLVAMVGADGIVRPPPAGLAYPVYTAAGAVIVLSEAGPRFEKPREAWLRYLCQRQLTEPLGWQPADEFYGGWGYARDLPRKPPTAQPIAPLSEPNLSATAFALAALRAAGREATTREIRLAKNFVIRCQNYTVGSMQREQKPLDGGFFFMLNDAVRNKAGVLSHGRRQRDRYASYGSATVDGLQALLMCGLRHDEPRVAAAWKWLAKNFSADTHPGAYSTRRESTRQAVYFYYCHSLAGLLADSPAGANIPGVDKSRWAKAIAEKLIGRQRTDGSWRNTAVDVREDDPLVATALAARALAVCRRVILVESTATAPTARHDDRTRHSDSTSRTKR